MKGKMMKFNFTVNIENCDDGYSIQDEILDRATDAFIEQVLGNSWDNKSMSYELRQKIDNKIDEICNKDFKDTVTNKVVEGLTNKVEKSKQYKELLKGQAIYSDAIIKTGLRDIVADIVKSEIKKVFNSQL